jgi:hypothetical protein
MILEVNRSVWLVAHEDREYTARSLSAAWSGSGIAVDLLLAVSHDPDRLLALANLPTVGAPIRSVTRGEAMAR